MRDYKVTGVQTCALPICETGVEEDRDALVCRSRSQNLERLRAAGDRQEQQKGQERAGDRRSLKPAAPQSRAQIGRAACREREWIAGDGRSIEWDDVACDG